MGCWRPCWRTGTHWATIAAQGGVGRPLPEVHGHRVQHDGLSDDFEPNPLSLCPMWSLNCVSIKHLGYKKAQLLSVNLSQALAKTCFQPTECIAGTVASECRTSLTGSCRKNRKALLISPISDRKQVELFSIQCVGWRCDLIKKITPLVTKHLPSFKCGATPNALWMCECFFGRSPAQSYAEVLRISYGRLVSVALPNHKRINGKVYDTLGLHLARKTPKPNCCFWKFHLGANFIVSFDHDSWFMISVIRDGPQIGWPPVMLHLSTRHPEKGKKKALAQLRLRRAQSVRSKVNNAGRTTWNQPCQRCSVAQGHNIVFSHCPNQTTPC